MFPITAETNYADLATYSHEIYSLIVLDVRDLKSVFLG